MIRARVCSTVACRRPSRYCRDFIDLDTLQFEYTISTVNLSRRANAVTSILLCRFGETRRREPQGRLLTGTYPDQRTETSMTSQLDLAAVPQAHQAPAALPVMSSPRVWP